MSSNFYQSENWLHSDNGYILFHNLCSMSSVNEVFSNHDYYSVLNNNVYCDYKRVAEDQLTHWWRRGWGGCERGEPGGRWRGRARSVDARGGDEAANE